MYLDCGGGYTIVYVCQNSQNLTLKKSEFLLYVNGTLIKVGKIYTINH